MLNLHTVYMWNASFCELLNVSGLNVVLVCVADLATPHAKFTCKNVLELLALKLHAIYMWNTLGN